MAARGFLEDIRSFRPDVLHVHYAGGRLGTAATLSEVRPLIVTVIGGGCASSARWPPRLPGLYSLAGVAVSVPSSDGLPQS